MESLLHGAFSESPSLTFIDSITPALHTLSTLVRVYFFMYVLSVIFLCAFCLFLPLKEDTLGAEMQSFISSKPAQGL